MVKLSLSTKLLIHTVQSLSLPSSLHLSEKASRRCIRSIYVHKQIVRGEKVNIFIETEETLVPLINRFEKVQLISTVVIFNNILQAAFCQFFFHKKYKHKYRKGASFTVVQKAAHIKLVKLTPWQIISQAFIKRTSFFIKRTSFLNESLWHYLFSLNLLSQDKTDYNQSKLLLKIDAYNIAIYEYDNVYKHGW